MQVANHTFEKQYAPQNRFTKHHAFFACKASKVFKKSASRNGFFKVIVSKRRFRAFTVNLYIQYNNLACEVAKHSQNTQSKLSYTL